MTPPALEIADLIRTSGAAFIERNRQWIRWRHVKVLLAIARCAQRVPFCTYNLFFHSVVRTK